LGTDSEAPMQIFISRFQFGDLLPQRAVLLVEFFGGRNLLQDRVVLLLCSRQIRFQLSIHVFELFHLPLQRPRVGTIVENTVEVIFGIQIPQHGRELMTLNG
jgi:hypothetical protein